MPYRNMDLQQFAKHIGMDLRDVVKLAERGKLPGEKIAGQWRFNRGRVTEWLQQVMPTLSEDRLVDIERAMGDDVSDADRSSLLTGMVSRQGVDMCVRAGTRTSILHKMVDLAERTELLYDKDGLLEAIVEREGMCSTAMPNSVAIPHPRQPMPYVSAEPLVCLARVPQGIPFGSPNGVLTVLFFLVCSHDDRRHLQTLARLVRILDRDTIEALCGTEDADDALGILIRREKEIAARGL